jgi:SAM-dependent methyltransferase
MLTIKHINLYSAYSLLNKNIIITYKIDGIPIIKSNYCIEKVGLDEYLFPNNFDFNNFLTSTSTTLLNIQKYDVNTTYNIITNKKYMIAKTDLFPSGNIYVKNFFYINSQHIFQLLELLKKEYDSPFPNDGFIIYNLDSQQIYKLKPFSHMTIDLRKEGNFFYSNEKRLDNLSVIHEDQKDGIYRLHPLDKSSNSWKIGDKRIDKTHSNPLWLINEIRQLIRNDFDYNELNKLKLDTYYHKYSINTDIQTLLSKRKEKLIHKLKAISDENSYILDFGCGFGNYTNQIDFAYYLGIDKDLQALESITRKKKCYPLWMDFSNNVYISTQINTFGNIWNITQRQNYNKLKKNYSLIIFNHSIHNVKNLKGILSFLQNNYKDALVYIGTFDIKESFENKYQKMKILEETNKKFKVKFYNSWINKELEEEYYKIDFLKTILQKYQLNYLIESYNPSIF